MGNGQGRDGRNGSAQFSRIDGNGAIHYQSNALTSERRSRSTPNISEAITFNPKTTRVYMLKPVAVDMRPPPPQVDTFAQQTPYEQRNNVEHWLKTHHLSTTASYGTEALPNSSSSSSRHRRHAAAVASSNIGVASTSQGGGAIASIHRGADSVYRGQQTSFNADDYDAEGTSSSLLRAHTAAATYRQPQQRAAYTTTLPPPAPLQVPDHASMSYYTHSPASSSGDRHFSYGDNLSANGDATEKDKSLHLRWSPRQARRVVDNGRAVGAVPVYYNGTNREMYSDVVDRGYGKWNHIYRAENGTLLHRENGPRSVASLPINVNTLRSRGGRSNGSKGTVTSRKSKTPSALTVGNRTLGVRLQNC